MTSIQKIFKVRVKSNKALAPESSWVKGAKSNSAKPRCVYNAYSIDLNMSVHCPGFKEDIDHQREMIVEFISKNINLFSAVDIYAENKGYLRSDTRPFVYTFYKHSKIHWHGMLYFHKEHNSISVVERLIKTMRKRFSCQSATTTFRSVFYKQIKNQLHLDDRVGYQCKQQPLLCKPIKWNNTIKNI